MMKFLPKPTEEKPNPKANSVKSTILPNPKSELPMEKDMEEDLLDDDPFDQEEITETDDEGKKASSKNGLKKIKSRIERKAKRLAKFRTQYPELNTIQQAVLYAIHYKRHFPAGLFGISNEMDLTENETLTACQELVTMRLIEAVPYNGMTAYQEKKQH